jgi:hypothetical protein
MERTLVANANRVTPGAYTNLCDGGEVLERHGKGVVPKE